MRAEAPPERASRAVGGRALSLRVHPGLDSRESRSLRVAARRALLALFAICAAGCTQPQPLYRWGVYEDSLYQLAVRGTGDPATQVDRLAADVARTQAEHQRVPPGVHAHLGWLLYSIGRVDEARAHLDAERALYPESAKMIDTMLERISGAKPAGASARQASPSPQASALPESATQAPAPQASAPPVPAQQANPSGAPQ